MKDFFRPGGPLAQFDAAMKDITDVRGLAYGPPEKTFAQISEVQHLVSECKHDAIRHALEMICVKLVRLCQNPTASNLDSVIDISGYARTICMILDKEEASEEASEEN